MAQDEEVLFTYNLYFLVRDLYVNCLFNFAKLKTYLKEITKGLVKDIYY